MINPVIYASDKVLESNSKSFDSIKNVIESLNIPEDVKKYMAHIMLEPILSLDLRLADNARAFGDGIIFVFAYQQALELNELEKLVKE